MAVKCVLPGFERTEPGEHLCGLYQSEHQRKAMLVSFVHQGLTGGQRALCIVDTRNAEVVLGDLRDARTDPQEDLAAGRLCMLTPQQTYVSDGTFDPDRMIDLLRAQTDRAAAEGYAALRLVSDMSWAMESPSPCERLIEYESKLNEFLRGSKCLALCLYDRRRFDPALLLDVLGLHPTVVVASRFRKNVAYAPPWDLSGPDAPASRPVRQLDAAAHEKAQDELQQRDELFQQILKCSSDGINICEIDLKTRKIRLILCNDKYVEMSGRTREELMNADNLSEFVEDLRPSWMQFINELLRQGETCTGVASWV
ncbi:MAG: MEDS domain-containing protein, partial [Phycisphaerae bacterium]|nr:MEDS domain-containing protein [Phycisphaerae bacterium]